MRLLIIEDEEKTALYLKKGLSCYGFVVDISHNGLEGLFLSSQTHYDLVILDVMLPGTSGWEIIEVINIPSGLRESVYQYYIRVLDKHGRPIVETPNTPNLLTKTDPLKSHSSKNINGIYLSKIYTQKKKDYLIATTSFNISPNASIEVILDISYQEALIANYRQKMLIIVILGVFLALGAAYIVTKKGMHPLSVLTNNIKKIKATALDQRIDPSIWPTELQELGIGLNAMLSRLEQSFQQLSQFSGDLAHELRTPINNLIGEIEVHLSQNVSQRTSCEEILLSNLEETRRISKLIESMLFLAKIDDPRTTLCKIKLNVQQEISVIQEYYQATADESHIKISREGDSTHLKAEPILFRRMLNNVLSNALKYTPPGGSIHFSVKDLENTIKITCTDTGIGISAENLPNLFNRFYRTNQSRSKKISGYGLGLSIVKAITDLHDAKISIKSQEGKGTQVSIQFPK